MTSLIPLSGCSWVEKSTESEIWQLYILNLNKFHNNTSTLQGSYVFNQDLYFFERNPDFGVTLRSRYRDNLSNQYIDAGYNETRRFWDKSIIYRQRLYKNKLSQEIQYQNNLSYRYVSSIPSRNRNVLSHIFNYKLSYRPVYAWQFQLTNETGLQSDRAPLSQLKVLFIEVRPQINYAIRANARAFALMA